MTIRLLEALAGGIHLDEQHAQALCLASASRPVQFPSPPSPFAAENGLERIVT